MLTKIDLLQIRKIVKEEVRSENDPLKRDVAKMRKDLNAIVEFFDNEYIALRKRIERLERHLDLPRMAD